MSSPGRPDPTARPPRDQAARDAIERDLDRSLLVEAAAGSGKTECLARRMAAGIAAGIYEVEGMAAVTFTRKAAAELRGRFQLELERRLGQEADGARRQRIGRALQGLERLFAGTIHAFCAHLLRERPVEAGVAPGFTEQDEAEDQEFSRRAWRDFLDRERARGAPALVALEEAGLRAGDLDAVFRTVCTFADVEFPPGDAGPPELEPARRELEEFWTALAAELPPEMDPRTRCRLQRAALRYRQIRGVVQPRRLADLAELLEVWDRDLSVTMTWWRWGADARARRDRLTRLVTGFTERTVGPFLGAWRRYRYRLAVTLLAAGRDFAAEARRRADVLNYGDLLLVAARLLREHPGVRAALRARVRWLFVDEFQDTNPLQAEVILLLAAGPDAGGDWRRARPRPGALFVVGDPKQAIYRFTGADIETYTQVRRIIEDSGGRVVTLTTSFRARPALCQWANRVFRSPEFFPAEATPRQPAFQGLDPYREADGAVGGPAAPARGCPRRGSGGALGVATLTTPATVESKEVAEHEARAIARYIRAEVDAGRRRWSDFLVLTWKKAALPVYAAALDVLHVPAVVSGAVAFTRSREVAILAGLLRVLADPDDGVALVGVLRGPLFGLGDPELFRYRRAGGAFLLTAPLADDAAGPVAGAVRRLQALYRLTRLLPAPAAVARVLEDTGLLARAVAATPGGAEAGDLVHALDRVRQVTEAGGSLADAATALAEDLVTPEVESLPLEPGRRDVVRVMNLHKAKGLEAAVVFLADPLGGVRLRADVRVARDGPRPQGWFQIERIRDHWRDVLAEPEGWADHEAAELGWLEAEVTRLLYVAATRARDLLVVGRWAGPARARRGRPPARPWAALERVLGEAEELAVPGDVGAPEPDPGDLGPGARAAAAAARGASLEAARRPSWRVESVTGTAHRAGPYGHPLQAGRTREPDTGLAWGALVHALLEAAMRGPRRDREHLARVAGWLAVGNPELRRVIPEALDTVERVMAGDFWRRAAAAAECQVEVPFAAAVAGEGGGPPEVLHGVIDLAFRTGEGWALIDYKTDQLPLAALADRYAAQVAAYRRQWPALAGGPVSFAGLYGVREQQLSPDLGA